MTEYTDKMEDRAEIYGRLGWAMFLRVSAVTLLLGATAILQLRAGFSPYTVSLVSIYVIIGATYLFTAISGMVLKWVNNLRPFAYFQVCYDILLVTVLISVTGRVFSFLYILAILSASIILHRPGAVTAAWLSSLGYGILLFSVARLGKAVRYINEDFVEDVRALNTSELTYNIALDAFAFFLVAFLASYLTEKLRRTGIELAEREEDLEALEAWSENVIRSLSSGLITTDPEGKITSFNRAAEAILGKSAFECMGKHIEEIFMEPVEEDVPAETVFTDDEGGKLYISLSRSVLWSSKGDDIGRIFIFYDQTAYREMEERLKLRDRQAAVGQLAAGLAHEIRNPLASISGSIQLLRSDRRFSEDDRLLKILLRETERLNLLITEFLHFARPTSGQTKLVDLKELLAETVELFRHQADEKKDVKTILDCPDGLYAHLDTKLLHQVLWNLLVNAAQAMPGGGEIVLAVEKLPAQSGDDNEDWLRIVVSDNGPGIEDDVRDKIFEPFFTTKEYGTGLGLATAYRSVESMGGNLRFKSERNKGTSFIIDLPVSGAVEKKTSMEDIG